MTYIIKINTRKGEDVVLKNRYFDTREEAQKWGEWNYWKNPKCFTVEELSDKEEVE